MATNSALAERAPILHTCPVTSAEERKELGRWLAKLRDGAGLSQDDVAAELRVDRRQVSRWETGESSPTSWTLLRILRVVGADVPEAPGQPLAGRIERRLQSLEAEFHALSELLSANRQALQELLEQQTGATAELVDTLRELEKTVRTSPRKPQSKRRPQAS